MHRQPNLARSLPQGCFIPILDQIGPAVAEIWALPFFKVPRLLCGSRECIGNLILLCPRPQGCFIPIFWSKLVQRLPRYRHFRFLGFHGAVAVHFARVHKQPDLALPLPPRIPNTNFGPNRSSYCSDTGTSVFSGSTVAVQFVRVHRQPDLALPLPAPRMLRTKFR